MATQPLGIVSSQPLPAPAPLSIVDSQPLPQDQPSLLARAGSFVKNTLSKTADNMNLENIMRPLSEIDTSLKEGNIENVRNTLNGLVPDPVAFVKGLADKIHSGNASGATADVLPVSYTHLTLPTIYSV